MKGLIRTTDVAAQDLASCARAKISSAQYEDWRTPKTWDASGESECPMQLASDHFVKGCRLCSAPSRWVLER